MTRPLQASQSVADALPISASLHPASDFTSDGRPAFSAYLRHFPPSTIRGAVFSIELGGRITDGRPSHETTVAGCEGVACVISTDSSPYAGNG
jgi:hypothetical protein